jgi:hypothetical protein
MNSPWTKRDSTGLDLILLVLPYHVLPPWTVIGCDLVAWLFMRDETQYLGVTVIQKSPCCFSAEYSSISRDSFTDIVHFKDYARCLTARSSRKTGTTTPRSWARRLRWVSYLCYFRAAGVDGWAGRAICVGGRCHVLSERCLALQARWSRQA